MTKNAFVFDFSTSMDWKVTTILLNSKLTSSQIFFSWQTTRGQKQLKDGSLGHRGQMNTILTSWIHCILRLTKDQMWMGSAEQ